MLSIPSITKMVLVTGMTTIGCTGETALQLKGGQIGQVRPFGGHGLAMKLTVL